MTSCRRAEAKCVQRRCFQCGSVPLRSDIKGTELPPANILIPLERQLTAGSFYIMKLCSRLFVRYCPNCPKDNKFRQINPNFEEVRGGGEPWLMARWKARVEFLLSVIELLFLCPKVDALQGKMCQNSLPSGGVGQIEPRFQWEGVVPLPIY